MHTLADFRLIMLVHVASLWLSSQTQKGEPSFNYRCHSVCNWNDNIRNIATPPTTALGAHGLRSVIVGSPIPWSCIALCNGQCA